MKYKFCKRMEIEERIKRAMEKGICPVCCSKNINYSEKTGCGDCGECGSMWCV